MVCSSENEKLVCFAGNLGDAILISLKRRVILCTAPVTLKDSKKSFLRIRARLETQAVVDYLRWKQRCMITSHCDAITV